MMTNSVNISSMHPFRRTSAPGFIRVSVRKAPNFKIRRGSTDLPVERSPYSAFSPD
jgi:hypothetical protein